MILKNEVPALCEAFSVEYSEYGDNLLMDKTALKFII